jgi:Ca-activated chloride channel family protein
VGFNGGFGGGGLGAAPGGFGMMGGAPGPVPAGLAPPPGAGAKPLTVAAFARANQTKPGELATNRDRYADRELAKGDSKDPAGGEKSSVGRALGEARAKKEAYDKAREALRRGEKDGVQAGKLGVDLSVQVQNLRHQTRLDQTCLRNVQGRNCLEIGGVWIDEGFDPTMPTLVVKAQSDAYFRILERQPQVKDVYRLGNHLVWVTPNGSALVIDTTEGKEKLADAEIDKLFVARKK